MEESDVIELAKQFSKTEILEIAKELGIAITPQARVTSIIGVITADMEEDGVPDPEECSTLMREFMESAGYVDEDGNIIDEEVDTETNWEDKPTVEAEQVSSIDDIPEESLPECFKLAIADERDPSCNKCRVFNICHANRIARRPECYGLHFSPTAEECKACFEAYSCKILVESIQ